MSALSKRSKNDVLIDGRIIERLSEVAEQEEYLAVHVAGSLTRQHGVTPVDVEARITKLLDEGVITVTETATVRRVYELAKEPDARDDERGER